MSSPGTFSPVQALWRCMRTLANFANSAYGYTGAVVGVIAVASIAVFNLHAKAQRHWDADIDRIVAKQQEKKHRITWAGSEKTDPLGAASDDGIQTAALTTGSIGSVGVIDGRDGIGTQKTQPQPAKRSTRRTERRSQHAMPFVILPKFALNAATNSFLKLR